MVADYFPGASRARAMGILAAGIPVGGVLGLLLGGWLESIYGWRVAFMAVGLPGFACAVAASRLIDPTRTEAPITVRSFVTELELGARGFVRQFLALIVFTIIGLVGAYVLTERYGADSALDIAVISIAIGIGLTLTIWRWVRLVRTDRREETPFTTELESAVNDLLRAGRLVLSTPTLVYIFVAGAMISFGMNGLVGWGPTFMTREFSLSSAASADALGHWGLLGRHCAIAGGYIADSLRS